MKKLSGLFIFIAGAAAGSLVTWRYTKKIYEQRAQEEIDSVKEAYIKKPSNKKAKNPAEEKPENKDNSSDSYHDILRKEQYVTSDKSPTPENKPYYVISPEEFGEIEEYEQISLTYYADQILADENDDVIKDIDAVIGAESLTHFGEYEDDSVFVRNDRLKCDFEILMDTRLYSEVLRKRPHKKEA